MRILSARLGGSLAAKARQTMRRGIGVLLASHRGTAHVTFPQKARAQEGLLTQRPYAARALPYAHPTRLSRCSIDLRINHDAIIIIDLHILYLSTLPCLVLLDGCRQVIMHNTTCQSVVKVIQYFYIILFR